MIIINTLNLLGIELQYISDYLTEISYIKDTRLLECHGALANVVDFRQVDSTLIASYHVSANELIIDEDEYEPLQEFLLPIREELGINI